MPTGQRCQALVSFLHTDAKMIFSFRFQADRREALDKQQSDGRKNYFRSNKKGHSYTFRMSSLLNTAFQVAVIFAVI